MSLQQPDEGRLAESNPATLVLGSVHLLDVVLSNCAVDQRQQLVRILREVCHDCRRAVDEIQRRPVTELVRDVQISSLRAAAAGVRSWAARFLRDAAAARLAVWCWDAQDQPHLHNTLLLNSIALQAPLALSCLELRLPTLLATAVDRVLCVPGLQALTRLSLAVDPWPEADDTAAGERMLCNWACVSTAALQRSLEHLAALQFLELSIPDTERCCFDFGKLAPSLPPALTSLAVMGYRGLRRASGFPGQKVPTRHAQARCTAALADLAHLHRLQHLQLVNVLSAEWDQVPPSALAGLAHIEVVHEGSWAGTSQLAGLLSALGALPSLRSAHLQGCRLGADEQLCSWRLPPGLSRLALQESWLQDAGSAQLSAPALCSLSLKGCELRSCPRLSQLMGLTRLELHFAWDSPVPPDILCGLTALRSLDACYYDALQQAATPLPPLPQLTALHLHHWNARGVPLHLSGFTGLRDLQVDFCCFSWGLPQGLDELVCLTRLSLRPQRGYYELLPLHRDQLEPLRQLAVLEPASLAPPGWRPPGAAGDGAAGAGDDDDSSVYSWHTRGDTPLGVDSEDEQWEALTGLDAFYYF